jgi:hypothetical protein
MSGHCKGKDSVISKRSREYSIKFGNERIKISLSFQERKTLKISVCPDKTVTVDAPMGNNASSGMKV